MKIRTGYISNSSSSSFCIIGKAICKMKEINSKEAFDKIDKNKQYVIRDIDGDEGEQLVFLNGNDILEMFAEKKIMGEYESCNLIEELDSELDGYSMKIPENVSGMECYYGTCDSHYVEKDEFEEIYMEDR